MLMSGRIIQGVCGGILSSVIPIYVGEIASKDIRGKLGNLIPTII